MQDLLFPLLYIFSIVHCCHDVSSIIVGLRTPCYLGGSKAVPKFISRCARNRVLDVVTLRDNHHATVFFVNLTNPRGNFSNEVLLGYQTIRKTYDISVKFCRPDTGYGQNLQFFIHVGALFEAFPFWLRHRFESRGTSWQFLALFTPSHCLTTLSLFASKRSC